MREFVARPEHGVVWISGASSGIGRALALKLAGEGFKVAVTARSHEKLVDLQNEAADLSGSIIVLDGDVTNAEDMEHTVAAIEYQHGSLGLVILNAGICLPVHGETLRREDFKRSFDINLGGVVNCLVPAVRLMKTQGHGQIAIVSSMAGYGGLPTSAAYGATKAALINMAESLKFDLDRMGIRVQVVTPGFAEAAAASGLAMQSPLSAEAAAERIVAGLKGQAFEIAFPGALALRLKLLKFLPYRLYFRAVMRWAEKPVSGSHHAEAHPAE